MSTATATLPQFREIVRRNLGPVLAVIRSVDDSRKIIGDVDVGEAISTLAMRAKYEIQRTGNEAKDWPEGMALTEVEGFNDRLYWKALALCVSISLAAIWTEERDSIVPHDFAGPGPSSLDASDALLALAEMGEELMKEAGC